MIRHDVSSTHIVLTCTDCPGVWFAFAWTKLEAHKAGAQHLMVVHNVEAKKANQAGQKYKQRHAGRR